MHIKTEIQTDGGMHVFFPFALKDNFRKEFPNATWVPARKAWRVGSRSAKRLDQWMAAVASAAERIAVLDELQFSERELMRVTDVANTLATKLGGLTNDLKRLLDVKDSLLAARTHLDDVRKSVAVKEKQIADEKAEIEALLEGIIDLRLCHELKKSFHYYHTQVGAAARRHFNEVIAEIDVERKKLRLAGYRLVALDYMSSANFNRFDRDGLNNIPADAWYDLRKIVEDDD